MIYVWSLLLSLALCRASIPSQYQPVWDAIWEIYDREPTLAPKAVRLSWHLSGTYIAETGQYGSQGGHIRFQSQLDFDANLGLDIIAKALEPVYERFGGLTHADLYILAGDVAVVHTQGPSVTFCGGRDDLPEDTAPPDGLLPPADHPDDDIANKMLDNVARYVTTFFERMGISEHNMQALMVAHSIGRMHEENSGYIGTWDSTEDVMDNMYHVALATFTPWYCYTTPNSRILQYSFDPGNTPAADCSTDLPLDLDFNQNPFDLALGVYPRFVNLTRAYAEDQELMLAEFAVAWEELNMLGEGVSWNCKNDIVIIDGDEAFDPLDIFNLGYEGVAQLSFALLVVMFCLAAMVACFCLCGLDAKIKLAVHPSGINKVPSGYEPMSDY